MQKNTRIAIIGAGLGGLCLAQGLKKNGVDFRIFEKDQEANTRTQGYRIRINNPGRKALQECLSDDLYALFLDTCAASTTGLNVFNINLEKSPNALVESWSDGIKEVPDLKPNRLTLREILLQGLDQNIEFGKTFTDCCEIENREVELRFADGTNYIADVVIAADGVHSKIGATYCKDQKVNTGNITIYGRTFYSPTVLEAVASELRKGTSVIVEDRFSLIADAMEFNESLKNSSWNQLSRIQNYFYWAFIGYPAAFGLPQGDFYNLPSEEIFNRIDWVTRNWNPKIKALFQYCDRDSLVVAPIRSSLPKKKWKSRFITALGDAVHTMSPAGGVGANTAFIDAALLTKNISKALCHSTSLKRAISDYEDQMRIYSNQAIEFSLEGGEVLHGNTE